MENGGMSNYLFGPLGAEYCNYFYFLSVISFVFFIVVLLTVIYHIFSTKKPVDYIQMVLITFQPFLAYFVNRLFYTMCMNSNDV
tara:strand:+ start:2175 stop:2426 length:252 start_codon:yes stop_codon:yes gene_type:complete